VGARLPNAEDAGGRSLAMSIRPIDPTPPGGNSTVPPFSVTAAAVLSASSLARYSVQAGRCWSPCSGPIPAAAPPSPAMT
jgi:hypothetical protein